MPGESVALSLSLADKLSGPALKAASSLAVLEGALVKQRSISNTDSIKVAPIKAINGPSAAEAKAQAKEAAAAGKAVAAAEKTAQRERMTAQKAADRQRVAEERTTQKQLEKVAKDEANFQKLVVQNRLKADQKEHKEREALAKQEAKRLKSIDAAAAAERGGGTFENLGATLAELVDPAALAAAAVLGLGAALAAAVVGGSALAIQASELKNDTIDALTAFLGTQEAAESVYDQIGDITRDVAISQDRATGLARELSAAGITSAGALTDAIKSIGQVESVLGNEAGNKIQSVLEKSLTSGKFAVNAKQLAGTGVQIQALYSEIGARLKLGNKQVEAQLAAGKISAEVGVAALTKVLDSKFGAVAGKQVLDIGAQFTRLKDNISKLFEDVDTEGFLSGLQGVLSVFDQSTESGMALKQVITTIFDKVFDLASTALPYVRIAFKSLVLIGLNIWNAFRPVFAQFKLFDGATDGASSFASTMITVANAVGVVAGWFATLAGYQPVWYALAAVIGVVVGVVGILVATVAAFAAINVAVIAGIVVLLGWLTELGVGAVKVGASIITGLVEGLKSGVGFLVDAVKGLATSAINAFKDTFKIHSPSRVMMAMGDNLTLGLAHGIDLGAPGVNDSLSNVVDPVAAIAPAKAAANIASIGQQQSQPASSGKTIQVNEGAIQITITGIQDVEQLQAILPGVIKDVFVKLQESEAA